MEMTMFCCKTGSNFVFVKLKRILKLMKMCLLEIAVFGCNRQRLLLKIKTP